GIVAELPAPSASALPGADPRYTYLSVFHWNPLVNGYSGMYPASSLDRLERLHDFPAAAAIAQLRRDNVTYVIVHGGPDLTANGQLPAALVELGRFGGGDGRDTLYRMR